MVIGPFIFVPKIFGSFPVPTHLGDKDCSFLVKLSDVFRFWMWDFVIFLVFKSRQSDYRCMEIILLISQYIFSFSLTVISAIIRLGGGCY